MKKWVHYSEYLRFELWRHNMRTTLNVHLNTCKYKYWNITHNKAAYWWKLRLFTCKTLMNTVNSQTKAWFFYQKVFDIFWSAPICCCMFNVNVYMCPNKSSIISPLPQQSHVIPARTEQEYVFIHQLIPMSSTLMFLQSLSSCHQWNSTFLTQKCHI